MFKNVHHWLTYVPAEVFVELSAVRQIKSTAVRL